ncbi:hypothetical protein [Elizabethkingia anophelis]|uniref:Uncharacterized protein n=1 Tax=Elizabethkingia anophelis TaxID=1117645 RepID=A0AAU8VGQ6_9FLAO|nr:hypothetical protein [Elizabethkingia anophelis]AQX02345.1 hypothetical protein BBD32_13185 [Elizabethkingia anophelis]OPB61276.1 hypothetical protein BAY11_05980 [Elizabethkingia anophelis]
MKYLRNSLIIISISLLSTYVKAQMDTLSYLKQFEVNKAKYVGKPLSILLDDMTAIQPKLVFSHSAFTNKHFRIFSDFKFDTKNAYSINSISMLVYWQTPIHTEEANQYRDRNKSLFTPDERSFYGNKIIKDIKVNR